MSQKGKINVKERFSDGEIDLSMSDLDEVPVKEIAALKKTLGLDLSNNRIAHLPSSFTSLTFLTKLDLSRNEISELPEDFGSLSKLKHLDLYKNNLERLPLSFGQLSALKFLDLKDNPLIPTIAKVAGPCVDNKGCQQCARDIVKFYRKLQEEIDTEVEMREQARQKQLEINQQKKQEEKKKLKKERQEKHNKEAETTKETANGTSNSTTNKKKSKKEQKKSKPQSKNKNRGSFLSKLLVFFIFMLTVWLVFALQIPPTKMLVPSISEYYKLCLEKLPSSYRQYGQSFGDYVVLLQENTRNISIIVIDRIHKSEIFQNIATKVNSFFESSNK